MRNNTNKAALLDCGRKYGGFMEASFTSKLQFLSVELEKRRSDLTALLHVSEARAREAQENAREISALIDEAEAMINEAHDKYVSAETRLRQEAALRVLAERKLKDLRQDLRSYPKLESNTKVCSPRITTVLAKPQAERKDIGRDKSRPVAMVEPAVNAGVQLVRAQLAMKEKVKLASFGTFILLLLVALFLLARIDLHPAM